MHFQRLIIALSLVTTSAFPLYPGTNQREASRADPEENEAHDKTELTKDVNKNYKSYVDSSDLYTAEEGDASPVAEEMRRKLTAESERLGAYLRRELAELRERLSPSRSALSASAALRQRLAPLTRRLRSSLSADVRDLCGQLGLYLQGPERAEAQGAPVGLSVYRGAFRGMTRSLERSGAEIADIVADFQSETADAIAVAQEGHGGVGAKEEDEEEERSGRMWREMRTRLAQEVSSARLEAQGRLGALKAQLTALLVTSQLPTTDDVAASVNEFCQSTELQNQVFVARIERLFLGLTEEREGPGAPSSPSDPSQSGSLLQQDFSAKFSALMEDILHSAR
ncbi:hypothetical protein NHX12_009148 [Muraenolepis orangiensis]|uniref:Apolipoprotein E n=1 Tax=Muraenolepis orangiensis TaxID=630683 RepID=A0A9Q0DMU2_9TELE|nr:hypothetical protein NHX12_009148 [Muraenolepis orangiensis]